jgi:methyl-accepting chemotaxis protein
MSIKTKLFLIAMQSAAILFIIIAVSFFMQTKIESQSKKASEFLLPVAMLSKDVKFGVCDVQQFLTDASATKEEASIKESRESAKLLKENLQSLRKIYRESGQDENIAKIDQIEKRFDEYQKVGENMAQAYITHGTKEGNVIMESFDKQSDALAKEANSQIVKGTDNISSKISSSMMVSLVFGILGGIAMLASLFIVSSSILRSVTSIREISNITDEIKNGHGNLTKKIKMHGNDELSSVAKSTNEFIEAIRALIRDAKKASADNATTSSELASTSKTIQKNAEEQSQIANKIKESTSKISQFLDDTITEANIANENVKDANIILEKTKNRLLLPQQTNSYSLCCISNTWMLEKVSNFLWICY